MKKLFFLVIFLMLFSLVSSQSTCIEVKSRTTNDYLKEIPKLNSQLGKCSVEIDSSVHKLVGDGNVLVHIELKNGTSRNFYFTLKDKKLNAIKSGNVSDYNYQVYLDEGTLDSILNSNNAFDSILNAVNKNDITIVAESFWGKIKWFFARFFLPEPSSEVTKKVDPITEPTGKPENCDDTFLPSHNGYSENKELWDSYSSKTDKVCQSIYGKGIPSPCAYTVQLSVQGNPYYLCWYNE